MANFLVDYYETYSKSYKVEARSKEEAEEVVKNDILKDVDKHHIIVQIHGVK